ncbi:sulfur carrier protein ThiS adenylyltransferase ThiF [Oceanirhabdus sp. W0125-5]|uniref:sulfur carrier protein ThiS adenylyltransferase ThiF n=1 Tax=Oceanirhabdus sp. W0125-5 TaxID=2999116 RepID=UPI0022F2E729|nr:sulfur carrier protein ThiS adenylyltransferase ThiF [Oceanirhabdus sp. W0125-5]WBW95534.1 sulfur carrier protein ThiS adenylyltransferase ThiF [Oceanirhabdus sp. W0125-5]
MEIRINDVLYSLNELDIKSSTNIKMKELILKTNNQKLMTCDILIKNGCLVTWETEVKNGDEIYMLKKGEVPSKEEMEMFLKARHSPSVHEKLKNATVGIAGLGGLGSNIAMQLARVGVGNLIICDFDVIDPTNLNRQNYFIDHIGMKKTDCTKEILNKINPYINVVNYDIRLDISNFESCFKSCDIIVEAFDNPVCKAELTNWVLMNTNKHIVAASGMAGYYSSNTIKTKKISDRFYLTGDLVSEAKEFDGLMAPRVGIVASHQSNCVLRILMNELEV